MQKRIAKNQSVPNLVPKSFFDLQVNRPKNGKDNAVLTEEHVRKAKEDGVSVHSKMIEDLKNRKEGELKALMQALALQKEELDDSMNEYSMHQSIIKRDPSAISRRRGVESADSAAVRNHQNFQQSGTQEIMGGGMNDDVRPVSKPTAQELAENQHRRSLSPPDQLDDLQNMMSMRQDRGFSAKARRDLKSGIVTNQSIFEPNITGALLNRHWRPEEAVIFDPYNPSVNMAANRAFNQMSRFDGPGAFKPSDAKEIDNIRRVERNMAVRKMLDEQIAEKSRRIQEEKTTKREEEKKYEEYVKRMAELELQRYEEEKRKDEMKRKAFQQDK
jgi:hypothetical protein